MRVENHSPDSCVRKQRLGKIEQHGISGFENIAHRNGIGALAIAFLVSLTVTGTDF
jgi:hypothetical protein